MKKTDKQKFKKKTEKESAKNEKQLNIYNFLPSLAGDFILPAGYYDI